MVKNSEFYALDDVQKSDVPFKFFNGHNFRPPYQIFVDNFVPLIKTNLKKHCSLALTFR